MGDLPRGHERDAGIAGQVRLQGHRHPAPKDRLEQGPRGRGRRRVQGHLLHHDQF